MPRCAGPGADARSQGDHRHHQPGQARPLGRDADAAGRAPGACRPTCSRSCQAIAPTSRRTGPRRARSWRASATAPDKTLKVKVSTRNISIYRDPAVLLIDQLKSIHIDGELDVVDTSIWHAKVTRKEFAVGLNLTGVGVDDPDVNLYENYSLQLGAQPHAVLQQGGRCADRQAVAGTRRRQAQADRMGDREAAGGGSRRAPSSPTSARRRAGNRT